eukprot:CAMPEP_0170195986 /NCGR_PEP_ID=MMETSP0040_2-20121228/62794_1 /TAXON_ID=641309 /ORGANISM="Lotharella oceanica, Strain CCMP622" /LENGTH=50 /DNA_ID=CAMNT_0010445291 /DNA_START=28 /DNA_END=180 /DNA_ORIENTATION=-
MHHEDQIPATRQYAAHENSVAVSSSSASSSPSSLHVSEGHKFQVEPNSML